MQADVKLAHDNAGQCSDVGPRQCPKVAMLNDPIPVSGEGKIAKQGHKIYSVHNKNVWYDNITKPQRLEALYPQR